jgi:hypothetical protein
MIERSNEFHVDEYWDMSDIIWRNCIFDGCILYLSKHSKGGLYSCYFTFCMFKGHWPQSYYDAMKAEQSYYTARGRRRIV